MLLRHYLLWLMAPDRNCWKPMLMGLALSAAAAGAAVLAQPSLISLVFLVLAMLAWFVGGCGMVGYVRWYFAAEMAQSRKDHAGRSEKESQ